MPIKLLSNTAEDKNDEENAVRAEKLHDTDSSGAVEVLQSKLNQSKEWKRVARVNRDILVRTRRFPPRVYRYEGNSYAPLELARGLSPAIIPFPLSNQTLRTREPKIPEALTAALVQQVRKKLTTWRSCLTEEAWARLYRVISRKDRDELHCHSSGNHRQRSGIGHEDSEIRVGPNEYHPVVRAVLSVGFTIRICHNGKPRICVRQPLTAEAFGFNIERLR